MMTRSPGLSVGISLGPARRRRGTTRPSLDGRAPSVRLSGKPQRAGERRGFPIAMRAWPSVVADFVDPDVRDAKAVSADLNRVTRRPQREGQLEHLVVQRCCPLPAKDIKAA